MFNVFVSSTYMDLKSYRDEVRKLIGALGLHDIAMEKWPPGIIPPLNLIEETMSQSDVYVGIIAWIYGSRIEGTKGISFTEYEYNLAKEKNLPRLVFLHDPNELWLPSLIDIGRKGTLLVKFRDTITKSTDITWKYFHKEIDLVQFLSGALVNIISDSSKYRKINEGAKAILRIRQHIHDDFLARKNEIEYGQDQSKRDWYIKEISRCNIDSKYIQRNDVRKNIADWLLRNQCAYLFVIGPAGVGKTNFLIMEIIHFIIGGNLEETQSTLLSQAVVFIPVGSYHTEKTFKENIGEIAERDKIDKHVFEDLIINGLSLLIVDGLDEFVRNNGEEKTFTLLAEINNFINPAKSKILISCRDHIYNKLLLKKEFSNKGYYEEIRIPLLLPDEVKSAFEKRLGKDSLGYKAIAADNNLIRFAQKPLILEMMCRITTESWKKLMETKTLGLLYDLWFEEIISTSSLFNKSKLDDFVSEIKMKVGKIAGIMLKKRTDLLSERELMENGLFLENLIGLTQQPFGLFIKQTPFEWGFVHDSFREFSLAKTIAIEFTSHNYDLLVKTSSFDYVGAETFAFLNDILPKSEDLLNHINTSLETIQSDQMAWNNIVRNSFETIGMISEISNEKFIDKAISIIQQRPLTNDIHTKNAPTIKTMYNLVRALERMHHSSPMPYFRHVLNKEWEKKPSTNCFGAVAIRGFHAPAPYPDSMPPTVYKCTFNENYGYRQEEVSKLLLDILLEAQSEKGIQEFTFLEINSSYALIRWLHLKHIDNIKELIKENNLSKYTLGNIFQAFLRFRIPYIFDDCTTLFTGMELSWVYLNNNLISDKFKFCNVVFDKYKESIFIGFHPSKFENCIYQ